jgi:hypothetical protein
LGALTFSLSSRKNEKKVHQELLVVVLFAFGGRSALFFRKWFYLRGDSRLDDLVYLLLFML